MSEPSPTALALARMRAGRVVRRPDAAGTVASWEAAAELAGRRLCDVTVPGGSPLLALGWLEGSEPVAGDDTGVNRIRPSPVVLLTFAAALRACWPDRSEHPFPGVPVDEDRVLAAVAALGPLTRTAVEAGDGSERHRKGALRRLRDAGFIDPDERCVRLGPAVAVWSDAQIAALRSVYDQLPLNDSGGGTT